MEKKILVDSLGLQETRIAVTVDGVVEDFYIETENEKSLKGNIYLAKVSRIEPALQAAFVDYGDDQHGFLPFGEIHPNYFRIPVEDREALYAEENALDEEDEEEEGEEEEDEEEEDEENGDDQNDGENEDGEDEDESHFESFEDDQESPNDEENLESAVLASEQEGSPADSLVSVTEEDATESASIVESQPTEDSKDQVLSLEEGETSASASINGAEEENSAADADEDEVSLLQANAEETEESQEHTRDDQGRSNAKSRYPKNFRGKSGRRNWSYKRRKQNSSRRLYRIQEVIKKNQIILVQVTKERRGNKGVSLSSYIALASRYCVFMANSTRGGGVSRKIGTQKERSSLKNLLEEMDIPKGQALILRTAGAGRSKEELKKDYEDILGVWNDIRTKTMEANAPSMIHEEADLAKRLVRDFYDEDVKEILISGDRFYKEVRDHMGKMLSPHKRRVKKYKSDEPIFQASGVEDALDSILSPKVFLPSGGYIIIAQTEALVSIDVNSGRAIRERSIGDTAVRTNLEAAEEISRQLRLRDLAGLVVIDFIDMVNHYDRQAVEEKMKELAAKDRARTQIGFISNFGLLEMSRQRLRSSINELGTEKCKHCQGTGYVMSQGMLSRRALRLLEAYFISIGQETLSQFDRAPAISIKVPMDLSIKLLNEHKRELANLEDRYHVRIRVKEWTAAEEKSGIASEQIFEVEPDRHLRAVVGSDVGVKKVVKRRQPDAEGKGTQQTREKRDTRRGRRNEGSRRRGGRQAKPRLEEETSMTPHEIDMTSEAVAEIEILPDLSLEPQPDTGEAYDKLVESVKDEKKKRRNSTRGRKKNGGEAREDHAVAALPSESSASENNNTNSNVEIVIDLDLDAIGSDKENSNADFQFIAVEPSTQEPPLQKQDKQNKQE